MKNILFILLFISYFTGVHSQVQTITVIQPNGQEGPMDLPESMESDMDSLYWDWVSKNYIFENEDCQTTSTNPPVNDSIYIERLSRIPAIIEMPYNDAVKKLIESYTTRLRSKVSYMLAAANLYMPIIEEALEAYDLPLELKYLPIIESALNPSALSRRRASGLWQFILSTGKRYGLENNSLVDERRDPIKSTWSYTIFTRIGIWHWLLIIADREMSTKQSVEPMELPITGKSTIFFPEKPEDMYRLSLRPTTS